MGYRDCGLTSKSETDSIFNSSIPFIPSSFFKILPTPTAKSMGSGHDNRLAESIWRTVAFKVRQTSAYYLVRIIAQFEPENV
jgi:hypothetical protein